MSASATPLKDDHARVSETSADPGDDSDFSSGQTIKEETEDKPIRTKKGRKEERAKARRCDGEARSATAAENPGLISGVAAASGGVKESRPVAGAQQERPGGKRRAESVHQDS